MISGDPNGALIGRRGQTLDALEYVIGNRVLAHERDGQPAGGRSGGLSPAPPSGARRALAQRVAERARRRGKPRVAEPDEPRDRRVVHLALQGDPTLTTRSAGAGFYRSRHRSRHATAAAERLVAIRYHRLPAGWSARRCAVTGCSTAPRERDSQDVRRRHHRRDRHAAGSGSIGVVRVSAAAAAWRTRSSGAVAPAHGRRIGCTTDVSSTAPARRSTMRSRS